MSSPAGNMGFHCPPLYPTAVWKAWRPLTLSSALMSGTVSTHCVPPMISNFLAFPSCSSTRWSKRLRTSCGVCESCESRKDRIMKRTTRVGDRHTHSQHTHTQEENESGRKIPNQKCHSSTVCGLASLSASASTFFNSPFARTLTSVSKLLPLS